MRNFFLSVRQIIQFQFWPHRRYCHVILGLQLLWKYDVILIFQNGAAVAQYYFRFRICWCPFLQKVKIYQKKQISSTSMVNIISIYGWDKTTSGLEKLTSAILELYYLFPSRPYSRNLHFILHQPAEFRPNRSSHCGIITSYRFIKMAAADTKYYYWFRIYWYRCLQKVKVYEQTKFRRHISINGWNLTTSKCSPYWNSTSGFDLDHFP